ncbi:hypothetical protein PAXRUDRAFT_835465, partial [Paxillus rubicundulus Ve08.2h10]
LVDTEALRYAPFPRQFRPNDSNYSQDRTPRKRSRGEHQHTGNKTSALGYRSPCVPAWQMSQPRGRWRAR